MLQAKGCRSRKIVYQTRGEARHAAKHRRRSGSHRPYRCTFCGFWHTTTGHGKAHSKRKPKKEAA